MITGSGYAVAQLASLVGVKPRVIRYWVQRKLLPAPVGFGRASKYTEEHLLRARVIIKLRAQRTTMRAIRSYLNGHNLAELREFVGPGPVPPIQAAVRSTTQSAAPAVGSYAAPPHGDMPSIQGLPLPSRWDLFLIGRGLHLLVSLDEVLDIWQLAQQIVSTYRPIVMRMQRGG
jgi:DNA-binding transcriptional MerR regulator